MRHGADFDVPPAGNDAVGASPPVVVDPARVAALDDLAILDTQPEAAFDDVVRLATRLCATPVALVSLVAVDRQWFKARVGFPRCETDLDGSVCKFALAEPDLLVIPDLTVDSRTAANTLVTGEPFIRFYAGAPLRLSDGQVVGSLCVIDTEPRPSGLTREQADDLRALGRQVGELLELRRALGARDALLAEQEAGRRERDLLARTNATVAAAGGDLDAILDAVTAGAMLGVPAAEGAVVELVDGEDLEYRAVTGALAAHRGLRVPLHDSLAGRCALGDVPLLANDVLRDGQVKPHLAHMVAMRSAVLAPISRGGRVVGVLKLQSGRVGAFRERDRDLARLFAAAATAGLTAVAEAEEATARRRAQQRLDLLSRVSAALLTADDPARAVEPILAAGAASLGFDQGYLYDIAPDRRHLRLTHAIGASEEIQAALRHVGFDSPLCGIVAETRRPFVLAAVQATREPRYALARQVGIDAFAGYPVMSRGSVVGVISFCSARTPAFDAEALAFFETVARYVSAVRERIAGEVALREGDKRSRLAQEAGQVGTFEVDVETGLINVSAEFARIYGVPPVGLYSVERFETLVVPEDRAVASNDGTRRAGTAALDVEYRIRRADDGAPRWIARRANFLRDAAGAATQMFGTVQDVTDRHEAEEALRRSDARFRAILDTVETAFAIVEVKFDDDDDRPVDYRFVEANPAFERQAGVNLRGKWVTEFAPDLERFWFDTYGHVARTGEPANFENYAESFKRWFDVRAVRVGQPEERRIAIFFNDVTARRDAEERLRASEALARQNVDRVRLALAAGAIIGTWHWDLPSDRFTVDEAFARSFGLDPALGREGIPLAQIVATVHPDDQAGLSAAITASILRGGAYAHQYRVRRADGRYYWIEANGRVDHGPDGTPLSFPGVLLDVEERRAAQEALRESEEHWRGLFERLSEGFLVGEVVRADGGSVTDWRYVDVNAAWGALVGIEPSRVVGRTIREVFPGIEDAWVDEFADIVETGRPITFIRQVGTLKRWYEGRGFPLGPERFGVIFLEVTARVEADARRDALLALGERLRETDDVPTLVQAAAEIMSGALGATRAGYGLVDAAEETVDIPTDWCAPGVASVAGLHRFRTYGSYLDELRRGEVVAVEDVERDPRSQAAALLGIGVRALINVPVIERGQLVGLGFVHYAEAHAFTRDELAFVRTVADRIQTTVARVRAEADQRVLNEELSHRLKNTFAMVLSIATQTLRRVPDRAPVEAFEKRIHALSSAHDVLLRQSWTAAPAREVVKAVLAGVGHGDRIDVSGPEIDLGPRATLSLSLLLHELATNAAKYGALSVPNGRVSVDWRLDGEDEAREVTFDWAERDGPPVAPPTAGGRKGFGSRLIGLGLVGTGGVDLCYPPSGFRATMRAPLVQLQHS
ncbi:GAF domain-containing protein [Methylobacterium sp. NMS14P]|uniref:GAF domain-containing protein n=1 Tax=Methylobacterium sp. NMS14P TaxID=2894310 RepID=UPI0023591111|nr:GAF domain-containing protein [Methylobacterium sp. NMS14P]WCS23795.1 GAF domain-containing protein [Methylobacterium sp. NMS14P]